MKVSISYPPLVSGKGTPLLSQNRQFQWFSQPTYIYPVLPAYAATLLKKEGHSIIWDDGIAEGLPFEAWLARLKTMRPDLIAMESKTPVIEAHWQIIRQLKNELAWNPIIALFGDHVTALPRESMENSPVDFVLTGGDYDFLLSELCQYLECSEPRKVPEGLWYRRNGEICNSGPASLSHDLNTLPMIDRDLTRWELYSRKNGNFKYFPGTYTMAGRDCWWGKCTFCSWAALYPGSTYRTVSVARHLEEVGQLISNYGIKEIFDDSGCFPKGRWLTDFCEGILARGYHKRAFFGCNMRVGALRESEFHLMKRANFRFILIGIESVIQSTLDRLNKGVVVSQIGETLAAARRAGLSPHITLMMGYPWETRADAEATVSYVKELFRRGFIETLQATIVVPYPGTGLFDLARQNGWLLPRVWADYDMRQSVWKSEVTQMDVLAITRSLYKSALSPKFIIRKILNVRNINDLRFLMNAAKKLIGHVWDFRRHAAS
ncbi:Fe-S oxidoreductase [Desulfosarcina cetonica]|uniref:B12-binding domain-containing radical SAM protein n=1 Tax=Desulfosarcina cetonica TaxID=90730 RepID=UPI0006D19B71|nr:radical SAM protein [Desulfosarcina cetonica]VTR65310.1 Fe-S oxidoreductase [Desulfosarcina cetonica]